MSYLAVELYRSGQVDEAIKLISKIPNTHLNQEKSFEGICNINIALKKYKLAIYFAFKASQVDYKSKIEAALFTIMPKCNSSEQLEILAYVIRQLENREEDYWNNLAKLKMIVGKYYISLKHTKTGLDLIEKGLLEYPAIEEIVGIDLYLKSYNLDLINQAKIIKVALHHKEELYVFRRRRSIQKKTKPTSLRDGIFFHNSCELCKKDPIGFTKIKFQH